MYISTILCTHNRSQYLRLALESMSNQSLAPEQHELIIVNDGSTDDTDQVVLNFADEAPMSVQFLQETGVGLSRARNRGISLARGSWVAFLDDDAIAAPDWLEALLEVADSQPDAGVVGGQIRPIWPPGGQPSWYASEFGGHFSLLYHGPGIHEMPEEKHLYGTNVAFRRSALDQVGLFSPKLGRIGQRLLASEELELVDRLRKGGHQVWYTSKAVVLHHVPPERLRWTYLLRRSYEHGISGIVYADIQKPFRRGVLLRHALYQSVRGVPGSTLRWFLSWLPYADNQQARVRAALWLAHCLGEIQAACQLACHR
jgi:glycosyltransferase involved in cell wall biosynthesis